MQKKTKGHYEYSAVAQFSGKDAGVIRHPQGGVRFRSRIDAEEAGRSQQMSYKIKRYHIADIAPESRSASLSQRRQRQQLEYADEQY